MFSFLLFPTTFDGSSVLQYLQMTSLRQLLGFWFGFLLVWLFFFALLKTLEEVEEVPKQDFQINSHTLIPNLFSSSTEVKNRKDSSARQTGQWIKP